MGLFRHHSVPAADSTDPRSDFEDSGSAHWAEHSHQADYHFVDQAVGRAKVPDSDQAAPALAMASDSPMDHGGEVAVWDSAYFLMAKTVTMAKTGYCSRIVKAIHRGLHQILQDLHWPIETTPAGSPPGPSATASELRATAASGHHSAHRSCRNHCPCRWKNRPGLLIRDRVLPDAAKGVHSSDADLSPGSSDFGVRHRELLVVQYQLKKIVHRVKSVRSDLVARAMAADCFHCLTEATTHHAETAPAAFAYAAESRGN
jgi:hypothetical protein